MTAKRDAVTKAHETISAAIPKGYAILAMRASDVRVEEVKDGLGMAAQEDEDLKTNADVQNPAGSKASLDLTDWEVL